MKSDWKAELVAGFLPWKEAPRPSSSPTIDLGCASPRPRQFPLSSVVPLLPRKEVIQPQLPLRLPCYDFVPITRPTLDASVLAVRPAASGVAGFHDVTGGVYKARERIHRGVLTRGY